LKLVREKSVKADELFVEKSLQNILASSTLSPSLVLIMIIIYQNINHSVHLCRFCYFIDDGRPVRSRNHTRFADWTLYAKCKREL